MLLDPDISQPKRAKSMSIHGTEHSGNENLDTGAQFRYLAFSTCGATFVSNSGDGGVGQTDWVACRMDWF